MEARAAAATARRILVFHGDARVRARLAWVLSTGSYAVEAIGELPRAERALDRERFDLVIADVFTRAGRRLLERVVADAAHAPLVVVMRRHSLAALLDATQAGAWDFVDARAEPRDVLSVVRRALAYGSLRSEVASLQTDGAAPPDAYERALEDVRSLLTDLRRTKKELRARRRETPKPA